MNTPFTFPRTLVQDCRSICTRTGQLDPKVHFLSSYIMQNLIFFKVLACKTTNKFKLCSLMGLQDWKAFTLIDHCIPISKLISLESNQGYECKGINKLGQLDFRLFPVADRVNEVYSDRFSLNRAHCLFEQSQPSCQILGALIFTFFKEKYVSAFDFFVLHWANSQQYLCKKGIISSPRNRFTRQFIALPKNQLLNFYMQVFCYSSLTNDFITATGHHNERSQMHHTCTSFGTSLPYKLVKHF